MESSNYITNLAGQITQSMPFGELLADEHVNSYNTPFKFNAKEHDAESGLYYYGARYYDAKWSVWLSVDPLAEKYPSWSPYNYTLQNPINLIDPDGRSPKPPKYAYLAISLGNKVPNGNFKFRADNMAYFRKYVQPVYSHSGGISE